MVKKWTKLSTLCEFQDSLENFGNFMTLLRPEVSTLAELNVHTGKPLD